MTTRFLRPLVLLLASFVIAAGPMVVFAQGTNGGGNPTGNNGGGSPPAVSSGGLQNPLSNINSLPDLVNAILDAVVNIGGIVLVLALVYTGFLFVAAQGNEEKIRNARSALMWTVIGGLVLLGAKAISLVIESTVAGL